MMPKDPESHDEADAPYDDAELAEAQRLAQALATNGEVLLAGKDVAASLAEPVAVARMLVATAPRAASRPEEDAARLLAPAEEALRRRREGMSPPTRRPETRRRKPWWLLLLPALGVPAMGAWMFMLRSSERPSLTAAPALVLPAPAPSLVAAQARAVRGSREAWDELERETRRYRERVLTALAGQEALR